MQDWKIEPARDLGLPLRERFRSLKRESGLLSTGLHIAWWTFIRTYMAAWHRLTIHDRHHIPPQPPFILVSNHTSHLDAMVLASPLPWWQRDRIFPIAAGDVFFETPVLAAFAAGMLNALPLWRKKCGPHEMPTLRKRLLEEPCAYILFPEGGRSRDGTMLRFRPGLGMLVAGTRVPVVPCHLSGCLEALHPEWKWPRPRRITMRIGEPVVFPDVPDDRDGWLQVAGETEERVKALAAAAGTG